MSGHSKWSTIKHKKALVDAKRGALFGKLARAISVAAKDNPDPETNSRLKDIIQQARAANMPKDKIESAIKKTDGQDVSALTEVQFEFIGPGEAAIIATGITDNNNRTVGELKKLAADHGARMVNQGSVAWMFKRMVLSQGRVAADADAQQLALIDAGADDVSLDDNTLMVTSPLENAEAVKRALGDAHIESRFSFVATTPHTVSDGAVSEKLRSFLEALDDHDDIQDVSTNADL